MEEGFGEDWLVVDLVALLPLVGLLCKGGLWGGLGGSSSS